MTIRDQRQNRKEYDQGTLRKAEANPSPFQQFERWLEDAKAAGIYDYQAMTLATVSLDGQPSARIVLLKHFDESGFCWYTDCSSRKGLELESTPKAALVFFWNILHRQVRVEGSISRLPESVVDSYFASRPAGSRLAANASRQSQVLNNRDELETKLKQLELQYPHGSIDRPERWGGYCLNVERIEFWQGRRSRLHDRLLYRRDEGQWIIERLSP